MITLLRNLCGVCVCYSFTSSQAQRITSEFSSHYKLMDDSLARDLWLSRFFEFQVCQNVISKLITQTGGTYNSQGCFSSEWSAWERKKYFLNKCSSSSYPFHVKGVKRVDKMLFEVLTQLFTWQIAWWNEHDSNLNRVHLKYWLSLFKILYQQDMNFRQQELHSIQTYSTNVHMCQLLSRWRDELCAQNFSCSSCMALMIISEETHWKLSNSYGQTKGEL